MKTRNLAIAVFAAALLSGCASYGYRGGSGDYYYGRSAGSTVYYGAPYGSVGYGWPGGFHGSVGYGYPGYYRYGYGPRYPYYGYGPRYPSYGYGGYYPPYYYGRPIVRPRPPGNQPPRESRPGAPWRDLSGITRVEHRERPERIGGPRPATQAQGQRERIQPSAAPVARQPAPQQSAPARGSAPWRGGGAQTRATPERVQAAPAAVRQSAPPAQRSASPAPTRRSAPPPRSRESDGHRTQEL